MPATSPASTYQSMTCPTCGHAAPVRVDGSIGRHRYNQNGTVVVCTEGDRGPKRCATAEPVVPEMDDRQKVHHERVTRVLAWIGRQRGYRATARGDHFLVVGPRDDRPPVRIPRAACEDREWDQVLAALYRAGLVGAPRD